MSDDDAMESEIRRSPRKREAESGNAADAARKIIKNKEKQKNGDGGKTKDKQKMDKDKTAVETSAMNPKKTKTAQKGVTEEVKAEDDNMFGVDPYTDAEAKKQLEAQNKLLKSSNARPKTGKYTIDLRNELRQRPENVKAAEKRKKDEEECLRLLEADNGVSGISPTSSRDGQESNDEDTSALKKTPLPKPGRS